MDIDDPVAAEPAPSDQPVLIIYPPESTLQRIRGKGRRPQYLDLRHYPGLDRGAGFFAMS